jgi:hypothetical protein
LKPVRLLFALPFLVALLLFAPQSTGKTHAAYVYEVYMYGENVVPGVDTDIYGFLRFFFNETMTEADITVDVKGISGSGVTGADIRAGPPGANGPVIFHLSDGEFIVTSARIRLTPADLQHMVNGDWYGVLYTSYHPNGEIRAQINLPPEAIGASPPPPPAPTATLSPVAPPPSAPAPTVPPPPPATGGVISPPNTGDAGLK